MTEENKARKMSGMPFLLEDIGKAIVALNAARDFTSTYTNATSAEPGVKIEEAEKLQERYAVAIRSLGQHLLEKIEAFYEPEERAYAFHGHEEVSATWKIKAKSKDEAMQKFAKTAPDGATWYAVDEGEVDPNETYLGDAEEEE